MSCRRRKAEKRSSRLGSGTDTPLHHMRIDVARTIVRGSIGLPFSFAIEEMYATTGVQDAASTQRFERHSALVV